MYLVCFYRSNHSCKNSKRHVVVKDDTFFSANPIREKLGDCIVECYKLLYDIVELSRSGCHV